MHPSVQGENLATKWSSACFWVPQKPPILAFHFLHSFCTQDHFLIQFVIHSNNCLFPNNCALDWHSSLHHHFLLETLPALPQSIELSDLHWLHNDCPKIWWCCVSCSASNSHPSLTKRWVCVESTISEWQVVFMEHTGLCSLWIDVAPSFFTSTHSGIKLTWTRLTQNVSGFFAPPDHQNSDCLSKEETKKSTENPTTTSWAINHASEIVFQKRSDLCAMTVDSKTCFHNLKMMFVSRHALCCIFHLRHIHETKNVSGDFLVASVLAQQIHWSSFFTSKWGADLGSLCQTEPSWCLFFKKIS